MRRNAIPLYGTLLTILLASAGPLSASEPTFVRTVLSDSLAGAAFASAGDVDGDGLPEMVTSGFGKVSLSAIPPGTVVMHSRTKNGRWEESEIVPASAGIRFPNETLLEDVDGDGLVDVVVPGGFFLCPVTGINCGSLTWWQQQPGGGWRQHVVVAPGDPSFFHRVLLVDLDADGRRDLVTVAETAGSAQAVVFAGDDSEQRFSSVPVPLGIGGGSLPVVEDVDGDGDLDLVSAQFFQRDASFVWFEQVGPPGPLARFGSYVRHVISADLGGSIQVAYVRDLGGPGDHWWVGSNHTNTSSGPPGTAESALYRLIPGPDPRLPWSSTPITEGIVARPDTALGQQAGAPGVFGSGDLDADGDVDLVLSGDADPRVLWAENLGTGRFATHTVADGMGQAGGAVVTNPDGRGPQVLFTSYEHDLVALFRLAPGSRSRR